MKFMKLLIMIFDDGDEKWDFWRGTHWQKQQMNPTLWKFQGDGENTGLQSTGRNYVGRHYLCMKMERYVGKKITPRESVAFIGYCIYLFFLP